MKKSILMLIAMSVTVFCCTTLWGQGEPRYYQVKEVYAGTGPNWQDTLFVVRVSDPVVQAAFAEELAKPWALRSKIVTGEIELGSGGYNRNATHCFNWHFRDDTVELADATTEVCDGWPYQDCELSDFVNAVGYFCPWYMAVWQEVAAPEPCTLSTGEFDYKQSGLQLLPNPVTDKVSLVTEKSLTPPVRISVYNQCGMLLSSSVLTGKAMEYDMRSLATGVYIVQLQLDSGELVYIRVVKD